MKNFKFARDVIPSGPKDSVSLKAQTFSSKDNALKSEFYHTFVPRETDISHGYFCFSFSGSKYVLTFPDSNTYS
jgi:hypothetical protein